MKISLSSSPSSSSSFEGNLTLNSRNGRAGCLSGVLRRLLCSGSFPTYPSDLIKEIDQVELDHNELSKEKEMVEAPVTPGIVARLMGLEKMPEISLGSTGKNPDSLSRSRSMNSVNHWPEFEPTERGHRRVSTTLSFREAPAFLQLENEDFLLLSFENVRETKEMGLKERRCDIDFGELKQKKSERRRNRGDKRGDQTTGKEYKSRRKVNHESKKPVHNEKESLQRRISAETSGKRGNCGQINSSGWASSYNVSRKSSVTSKPKVENPTSPVNHKQVSDGSKFTNKRRDRLAVLKKVEPEIECNSENSSPVSVLELGDFLIDPKTPLSDEDSRQTPPNSPRKPSSELANSDSPPAHSTCITVFSDRDCRSINAERVEPKKADCAIQDYTKLWREISKLAEEDVNESSWASTKLLKLEDTEGMVIECGQQIMDQLLYEIVQELARQIPMKNFAF